MLSLAGGSLVNRPSRPILGRLHFSNKPTSHAYLWQSAGPAAVCSYGDPSSRDAATSYATRPLAGRLYLAGRPATIEPTNRPADWPLCHSTSFAPARREWPTRAPARWVAAIGTWPLDSIRASERPASQLLATRPTERRAGLQLTPFAWLACQAMLLLVLCWPPSLS